MVFNPQLNVRDPKDFLNMSRGVEVDTTGDTSLGTALKGAGDLITVGAKAVNTMFESAITAELEPQVDAARAAEGVDDATTIQKDAGTAVPGEITRAFTEAERMAKAVGQGTMKDSHYYGRLNAIAKQLRSKYAGHRDFIDSKMSSMVGVNPANALVRSLKSEAEEAHRKANSQLDKQEAFISSQIKAGTVSPVELQAYRNGIVTFPQMELMVTQRTYKQEQIKGEQQAINLRKAQGEAVEKDTNEFWERSTASLANEQINNNLTALGGAYNRVQEQIKLMSNGQIQTPEQKQALSNAFVQLELEMENTLTRHANQAWGGEDKRSFSQRLSQDVVRKTIDTHKARIKAMRDAAEKGDLSLLSQNKLILETTQTNSKIGALQDKMIERLSTARALLGDNVILMAIPGGSKTLSQVQQATAQYISSAAVVGQEPLSAIIKETRAVGGDKTSEREAILNTGRILADPKTSLQAAKNIVESFFGEANKGYLRDQPASERGRTLLDMTAPAVEARLWQLREAGDPNLWVQYKTWVNHNVVTNATPTLNSLASFMATENRKTSIVFDGTRFGVAGVNASDSLRSPLNRTSVSDELAFSGEVVRAQNIVRDLNAFYRPLHGMATREGRDVTQEAFNLVNMVGLGNTIVPMANVTTKGGSGGDEDRVTLEPSTGEEGDEDIKKRMEAEEKGAGVPGAPPDNAMFSEDLRVPADIMREVSALSPKEQAEFWKDFIEFRKKNGPRSVPIEE